MELKYGSSLQQGRYIIEKVLGQGGFGITYLACQTGLNRKVAVKEFFMQEYCNRDAGTSRVSVPSMGSRELVDKFKWKFIKEARNIAALKHKNIVSVVDVFEENGTAYYVMEYQPGGSLQSLLSGGALSEQLAERYIRQIASALDCVHQNQMMHLDVKPANILINEYGEAVLIDFGLAKRYDNLGRQTSTTPTGLSAGYAPMEQNKPGGVGVFSPATDIYSLGATLFKLLTGVTPPDASDVFNDGLPALPAGISSNLREAVEAAMRPGVKARPQSITEFLEILDNGIAAIPVDENDFVILDVEPAGTQAGENTFTARSQYEVADETTRYSAGVYEPVEKSAPKVTTGKDGKAKKSNKEWVLLLLLFLLLVIAPVLYFVRTPAGGYLNSAGEVLPVIKEDASGTATVTNSGLSQKEKAMINPANNYRSNTEVVVEAENSGVLPPKFLKREVFRVRLNGNEILVNDKLVNIDEVKPLYRRFLTNPQNSTDLPVMNEVTLPLIGKINVASKQFCTIVYNPADKNSSYPEVVNGIYSTINELRDSLAVNRFGKPFDNCSEEEKEACRLAYPCEVLEHEFNAGGENPYWAVDVAVSSPPEPNEVVDVIEIVDDEADKIDESQLVSNEIVSEYADYTDTEIIVAEEEIDEDVVFQVVEQQPEFPGGLQALYKYIADNINYPRVSRENGSQGRVFVRFVVNTDGSVQNAEVIRSSGDVYLDREAVRVVSGMPKWSPGKQDGKAVRVYFTVPVLFKLQ